MFEKNERKYLGISKSRHCRSTDKSAAGYTVGEALIPALHHTSFKVPRYPAGKSH